MKAFWSDYVINLVFLVGWSTLITASLVWVIHYWWRTSPKITAPAWRSYLAIGAIALVGLSELLWIVFGIWVSKNDGGWYDHPAYRRVFGFGFYAALAGLLASLLGKGTLRWPACVLSTALTFSWIFAGLAGDI